MQNTLVASAAQLNDTPGALGLIAQVDALLAPLDTRLVNGVQINLRDEQRRLGQWLDFVVGFREPGSGAVVLTHPFRLYATQGRTPEEAVTALETLKALHPAWWYSQIFVELGDSISGQNKTPYLAWLIYSEDPDAGQNWSLGAGQGGGGGGGTINPAITASLTVGGIDAGEIVPAGTDLDAFARQLLLVTFDPTFTAPTATLADDQPASLEVGTVANILLTMNFSRGTINGDLVMGVWNPALAQDFRSGAATQYIINGVNTGLVDNTTVVAHSVILGANTFAASVDYAAGPQPYDSDLANFGVPLAAGTLLSNITIQGRRAAFYGPDNDPAPVAPASSVEVRALPSSFLNPINGSTFTINIPIGTTIVVFAYPATLNAVASVLYVEGFNADVKGVFSETTVAVEGANGFVAVNYRVYTYIPVSAFPAVATYNVTI